MSSASSNYFIPCLDGSSFDLNKLLIVMDLDLTLWSLQVDKCRTPFLFDEKQKVVDSNDLTCKCYPEAISILNNLKNDGFTLAIASRITNIAGAYQLLHLFQIEKFFTFKAIYPGSKRNHFNHLKGLSGVQFNDMIFFDDDRRNIRDVSRLGVFCVHVQGGLSVNTVRLSISEFFQSRLNSSSQD